MTDLSLVTIVAPLSLDRLDEAQCAIEQLGNPAAADVASALDQLDPDGCGTHFASLHAFASCDRKRAWILLEYSADGSGDQALARVVAAIGERLKPVFMLASDWSDGRSIGDYLAAHRARSGQRWSDPPGLAFAGMPEFSVGRIRREARLKVVIADELGRQSGGMTALERLAEVRRVVGDDPELADLLGPADPGKPWKPAGKLAGFAKLVVPAITTYLWPFLLVVLAWTAFAIWREWSAGAGVWMILCAGAKGLLHAAALALAVVLIIAIILYFRLRSAEKSDFVDDRVIDRPTNAAMFERENRGAQNHMISITQRKPGLIRQITLRLVFWVIGQSAGSISKPGFLGSIGSIHFARWVSVPGSSDLVFLSNYDGSWESYLEDFITLAHQGLTGVWSNTVGFPKTKNLIQDGATDGERFKRFARHSMIPTRFWYSAYPFVAMSAIRANAEVRRGLSGAMTEDEAIAFLALFGSASRPPDKLVSSEVQSIVFGGLRRKKSGVCWIVELPAEVTLARQWLRQVTPHVAFNDGRQLRASAVVTLALGAGGMRKLGLAESALETFSFPFLEGMTGLSRQRLIGDRGPSAPEHWRWGQQQPDAALLIYGDDDASVAALQIRLNEYAANAGMAAPYVIPLKEVSNDKKEPFGFKDGISQPVIRGTYKGFRDADPIHLVEAGEFILGYPDNRGHIPPGPELPPTSDPANLLPLVGAPTGFDRTVVDRRRDLGFNGSYLVIRELEQDVAAFDRYCEKEAERLRDLDRLPAPYVVSGEFIAAKLVGRWRDGSSVARYPYESRTDMRNRVGDHPIHRPESAPAGFAAPIPPPPGQSRNDNDFLFGSEDPEALRCPFGSHIRRANPRESFEPGSSKQLDISNRHRIMRIGRNYQEAPDSNPGILFMCLNADIERQFEFLQNSWMMSPSFHGLWCEKDAILGDGEDGACGFTIPTRDGPVMLANMPQFVTTRGGGYFFLPSRRLIYFLSTD